MCVFSAPEDFFKGAQQLTLGLWDDELICIVFVQELRMQKVAATARFVQFVSPAQNRIDAARGLDIPALAQVRHL